MELSVDIVQNVQYFKCILRQGRMNIFQKNFFLQNRFQRRIFKVVLRQCDKCCDCLI